MAIIQRLYKELKKLGIRQPKDFVHWDESLASGKPKLNIIKLDSWAEFNGMIDYGDGTCESLKEFVKRKGANPQILKEFF